MRIIRAGAPKLAKVYTETCKSCGCVFTLSFEEYKYNTDHRDGDFLSVKCPEQHCKETVYRYSYSF